VTSIFKLPVLVVAFQEGIILLGESSGLGASTYIYMYTCSYPMVHRCDANM